VNPNTHMARRRNTNETRESPLPLRWLKPQ
jgi:hypothetical protein